MIALLLLLATADTVTEPFPGITYTHRSQASPRKEIHIVQIDLTRPEVRIRTTKSSEKGQTPSSFSDAVNAAAVVNGDFFATDGTFDPSGLAIGEGTQWSNDTNGSHFIACTAAKECLIETGGSTTATDDSWRSAVGGRRILKTPNSQWSADQDTACGSHCTTLHPRTAVGLKNGGDTMVLVVVEGRQDPIFGLKISQLASLMADLGCEYAMELDGGGSSTMVVGGSRVSGRPDNEPSERRVGNHLAIIYDATQSTTGRLVGYVREGDIYNDAAPISGATVTLSDGQNTTTNASGFYEFADVAGGAVTVTASKDGYVDATDTKDVEVGITNWKSIALQLEPAEPPPPPPPPPPDEPQAPLMEREPAPLDATFNVEHVDQHVDQHVDPVDQPDDHADETLAKSSPGGGCSSSNASRSSGAPIAMMLALLLSTRKRFTPARRAHALR